MAEGTYEYECMRAELLGIEKPDYDEFIKKKQEEQQQEEQEIENFKTVETENEQIKNISGGLDELSNILQATQRKINRFKASCGSLTNLLKVKIGGTSSDVASDESDVTPVPRPPSNGTDSEKSESPPKSDLAKALDNHCDRIDSLIEKAENSQYSMAHQSKQMKRFL